jgi:hypothetical protein
MLRRIRCILLLALLVLLGLTATAGTSLAVTVSVDPADTSVAVGDEFVVRFLTDTFPDLKGFKLIYPYDASRLQLLSATEGEVLTSPGGAYVAFLNPDITAPADTLWYDAAMLEGAATGPGVLVYATFKALAPGDAAINCGSVDFRDSFNNQTVPACAGAVVHIGSVATQTIKISQVYGGGGNSGATFKNDFIELFNSGGATVDVTGWSVQYASSSGSTWQTTTLSGTIPAGGYYLVQEAQGAGGTVDLPAPDAIGSIAMSATSGKVALVTNASALSGTCPSSPSIADLVGYGSASCSETNPAPALSNTTAALRHFAGCEDTDDNSANFSTGSPTPRNSATPHNVCQFTLNVSADPALGGTVMMAPNQATYAFGTNVTLTATPASGYYFLNWSGDASGSVNPLSIVMTGDKTIVANFTTNLAPHPIVISQIYGGGGNTGADYKNDYIELFNRGANPVDVTGWTVQYASTSGSTWFATTLIGTIQPTRYYLIQQGAGSGGTLDLPTPDAIGGIAMSATSGKVALVNNSSILAGNCPTGGAIEDFVGYGPADCSEGSPSGSLNNVSAGYRKEGGCVDTDDNVLDFETLSPGPRNSASPINVCSYWVDIADEGLVREASLGVMPNPTRGPMQMHFALPNAADARLRVFDLQGRVVATIADGRMSAGRHVASWDGRTAAGPARPGIYFVRLQAPGLMLKRTIVIAR